LLRSFAFRLLLVYVVVHLLRLLTRYVYVFAYVWLRLVTLFIASVLLRSFVGSARVWTLYVYVPHVLRVCWLLRLHVSPFDLLRCTFVYVVVWLLRLVVRLRLLHVYYVRLLLRLRTLVLRLRCYVVPVPFDCFIPHVWLLFV